jgi:putative MATE family efflux protein
MDYCYGMEKRTIRIPRRKRGEVLQASRKPQTSTRKEAHAFYQSLFALVLPIALQNLLSAAGSSANVIMMGSVSQTALSAVSLANQILFILNLFFAGLTIGANMLVAQYWGKGDTQAIEKLYGITLRLSLGIAMLFCGATCFCPQLLMVLFTSDRNLIVTGASYLRFAGPSYLLMSISLVYLCFLRSMERVRISTLIPSIALLLNIGLNALFLFELKLGVVGVALATVIAQAFQLGWCLLDSRRSTAKAHLRLRALFARSPLLFQDYLRYASPVLGNECVWGGAIAMYAVILGHLGADVVAANALASVVFDLATAGSLGVASGGAVLIGKKIGEQLLEEARGDASRLCKLALLCGMGGGILILLARPLLLQIAPLTGAAAGYLAVMLLINAYYVIGKSINAVVIVGVFCAGGDSRFGLINDALVMWGFSVPLGLLCAFVFRFPAMVVYFVLCMDEFVKMPLIYRHYRRFIWLKNITRDVSPEGRTAQETGTASRRQRHSSMADE